MASKQKRIYLDCCCYNRPFDDQSGILVFLETQAKLEIQKRVKQGKYQLGWSYVLDYEISKNPYEFRRATIQPWRNMAAINVREESESIIRKAEELIQQNVKTYDALHVACAIEGECNYFITTDKRLLRKPVSDIKLISPIEFLTEMEETQNED